MRANRIMKRVLGLLDTYRDLASSTDEDTFQKSPGDGLWSYSEVYSHVILVNRSSVIAIERCAFGRNSSSGGLGWRAWIVLFFGRFPGKLRAPDQIAGMVKKISREEAKNEIIRFQERLPDLIATVIDAPTKQKILHPRLGLLNAQQWLRFVEVHTRHHLKQLKRIDAMLLAKGLEESHL